MLNNSLNLRTYTLFLKIFSKKLELFYFDDNIILIDLNSKNLQIISFLLKNLSFFKYDSLINLFCVDTMNINRYFILYNLISTKFNTRLFLRVKVPSTMVINSLINIYPGVNWLEREVWDFFGIFFYSHGDLRRILTDYGFEGFPLRKNFPLTGFFEVIYDTDVKSVIYTFLETTQELRFYNFTTPWDRSFFF